MLKTITHVLTCHLPICLTTAPLHHRLQNLQESTVCSSSYAKFTRSHSLLTFMKFSRSAKASFQDGPHGLCLLGQPWCSPFPHKIRADLTGQFNTAEVPEGQVSLHGDLSDHFFWGQPAAMSWGRQASTWRIYIERNQSASSKLWVKHLGNKWTSQPQLSLQVTSAHRWHLLHAPSVSTMAPNILLYQH